jgi:hypothetical protein
VLPNAPDQIVVIPLMDNHEIRAVKGSIKVQTLKLVALDLEARVDASNIRQRFLAMLLAQVLHAPGMEWLPDGDLMTARKQLGHDAAQEVGISIVPVR